MSVQAVILAGGLGTRLRPLTLEVPKPMVPVGDRPFLEHQIAMLKGCGIDAFVFLIGYLGEQIVDHFGDGSRFGVHIQYRREQAPLGTGGALMAARDLLDETFLILYGDSFLPIEYGAVYRRLLEGSPTGPWDGVAIAYNNREHTDVKPNLALAPDGRVLLYLKDVDDPRLRHTEAGGIALRRSALEGLPTDTAFSLEQTLYPLLISRGTLGSYETEQRFFDIGTPSRLEDLRRWLIR